MEMIVVVLVVLLVAAIVVWWAMQRSANAPAAIRREDRIDTIAGWPPQATRIMSTGERQAWSTLTAALPGYMVLAQVPVARFTRVPTRNSYAEWLRRIGSHCADLVVCDMASHVLAVVQVDPAGGEKNERALRRRERLRRVLKSEGIPLHVWTEGALPTPDAARNALFGSQAQPAQPDTVPTAAPAVPAPAKAGAPELDERFEPPDAPQSTWFDDLDTAPAPLDGPARR
jgi:hypothetical protein